MHFVCKALRCNTVSTAMKKFMGKFNNSGFRAGYELRIINKACRHKYCVAARYLNSAHPVCWMRREEEREKSILFFMFAFTLTILILIPVSFWKLALPALVDFEHTLNMQLKERSSDQQEVCFAWAPKLLLAGSVYWLRLDSRQQKRVQKCTCSSEWPCSLLPCPDVKEAQLLSVRKPVLIRKPYCIFWYWKEIEFLIELTA